MGSKSLAPQGLRGMESHAQTRLLLVLWDLGGTDVRKGEVMKRVVRTGEKAADYQLVLNALEENKDISIASTKISLTPTGLDLLNQGLMNSDFAFNSQIGAKTANALLKWMRQEKPSGSGAVASKQAMQKEKVSEPAIASYEDFKPVVLEVYDRLNRDYNYDYLVPIYRIRREIGDRVSRSDFNSWLLKMQSNDILQLQGGSVEDSAPDKIEDSIKTEISGLRCYAKRLI